MIPISLIRENKGGVIDGLSKRHADFTAQIDEVVQLDEERKKVQKQLDDLLSELNSFSKEIGDLYKSGQREKAEGLKSQTTDLKEKSQALKENQKTLEEKIKTQLSQIPNVPHSSVHAGKGDEDNVVILEDGDLPN